MWDIWRTLFGRYCNMQRERNYWYNREVRIWGTMFLNRFLQAQMQLVSEGASVWTRSPLLPKTFILKEARWQQSRRIYHVTPHRTKLKIKIKRGTPTWNKQLKTTWRREDILNQGWPKTTSRWEERVETRKGPILLSRAVGMVVAGLRVLPWRGVKPGPQTVLPSIEHQCWDHLPR